MNYTLHKKYNKYSSLFDIYLTNYGKNEKYNFYIYQLNITTTKKKKKEISWNTEMKNLNNNLRDTVQFKNISSKVNTVQCGKISSN